MNRHFLKILSLSLLALLAFAPQALAQSQTLDIRPLANQVTGEALVTNFRGVTHDGAYNFSRDGKARARYIETHQPNGDVLYREGDMASKGIWFIRGDTLCFTYENAAMSGGCFRVYKVKNCFYYYSNRLPRREDELDRDYWVARSTRQGEDPQCEAAIS